MYILGINYLKQCKIVINFCKGLCAEKALIPMDFGEAVLQSQIMRWPEPAWRQDLACTIVTAILTGW